MTADELLALLADKFTPPAWAFVAQVRNATGFGFRPRTADAVAMGLWPSRGLELNGFEIKVNRGDWLRELRDPEKAEDLFAHCHRWWIVVPDGVVLPEELPPTWGLLAARHGLRVKIQAPRLSPKPLDYDFLAAVMRRTADGSVPAVLVDARIREAVEANEKRRVASDDLDRKDHAELKARVAEFERFSGITISGWRDVAEIGKAVRLVLNGGPDTFRKQMRGLLERAKDITADVEKHVNDLDATVEGSRDP